jgi:hypothetical protein
MTVSVFVGTSVDGFIARRNGDFDFLPAGGGEPRGYDEFMASVDALVIGRKTFETVLRLAVWPYGNKRVVVLSSRPVDLSAANGGVVEQMSGAPAEIVSKLGAKWCPTPLCGRRDHDSKVPVGRSRSTSHHHQSACAHWRRNSSLRHSTARRAAPSRRDSAFCERLGEERVSGYVLTIPGHS